MTTELTKAAQPTPDAIREHLEGVARRTTTDEQFNAFKWIIDTTFESLDLLPTSQQATPEPVGEPVGEIVRSFSTGSGLEVKLRSGLTSDTPGIVGTKLFTCPAPGVPEAWDEGYRQGVEDERISEANIGIAGFGAKVSPARQNPYRAAAQARTT